ncbi:MAG: DUF2085 domain-containing protein [Candidatus Atribacteria bacterium]|nr:DUF2085 domain-containing protein [Candidatus Atribacteria bacterium]
MKFFRKYWIVVFGIAFGFYAGLPFLAPVFMHIGWKDAGNAIYFIYSFLCHQLPERSFFLFGPKLTYTLQEIHATGQNTTNIILLRKFIGNSAMGWKVAWSDRMVSMFTSLWAFGLLWWPFRKRLPKIPLWGFILFLLPMAVDGGTHFLSDFSGIGLGFRDANLWLATLSNNVFRPEFYAGDAWGSFNSMMRLLTGVLFGLGVAWFAFPYLDDAFSEADTPIQPRS